VDCLFFDQIGARQWLRDLSPAAPSPEAYTDGWIDLLAPYADRCLMVEDGFDRLAGIFAGFHSSLLLVQRQEKLPDHFFGAGTWEPYPLALWLFHDKVLLYQHDLYEGTFTTDPEVLAWNMAYGYMLSHHWNGLEDSLADPWLELVARVQRVVGPRVAGAPLRGWRELAPGVTETRFDDLVVVANLGATTFDLDGHRLPRFGFIARTPGGAILASAVEGTSRYAPGLAYSVSG
jgi:hypothetical protein